MPWAAHLLVNVDTGEVRHAALPEAAVASCWDPFAAHVEGGEVVVSPDGRFTPGGHVSAAAWVGGTLAVLREGALEARTAGGHRWRRELGAYADLVEAGGLFAVQLEDRIEWLVPETGQEVEEVAAPGSPGFRGVCTLAGRSWVSTYGAVVSPPFVLEGRFESLVELEGRVVVAGVEWLGGHQTLQLVAIDPAAGSVVRRRLPDVGELAGGDGVHVWLVPVSRSVVGVHLHGWVE